MDRHSFLSSQPFLYSLPSSAWPPQMTDDPSSCRREILLRDHLLSVEPLLQSDTAMPAFFNKSPNTDTKDFDPAMCKFEFTIHTAHKKIPSPKRNDTNTPSRTPLATVGVETKESIGFFYIDERPYQVDLGNVREVDLKMESDETKPPSLVVQFPNCTFRIFSMIGIHSDQFSVLNAAKTRILDLMIDHISPFPLSYHDIMSPIGSVQNSSSEPGQKEIDISHETAKDRMIEDDTEPEDLGESVEDSAALIQRCQMSYNQTRENLQTLQCLLGRPSARSNKEKANEEYRKKVSGRLNAIADNMGSSFCTRAQLFEATEVHNEQIHSCQLEVEEILKAVWPNIRPKKRARLGAIDPKMPPLPQHSQSESVASIKSIMAKHKELIRSKCSLAHLPTRG